MKKIALVLMVLALTGCPALDIIDAVLPAPKPIVPVCGKDTVNASYQGKTCLKWTDGSYRWTK
jgi:hypothetical protein